MSQGAHPTPTIRGALAAALVLSLTFAAGAGIGPDADGPPGAPSPAPLAAQAATPNTREAKHIGSGRPADRAAPAEPQAHPSAGTGWFFRTALALGGVVTLIVISGAVTRALARGRGGLAGAFGAGGRAPSGVISVLGRYPVSRGQKLVLLHMDRRILLISQSAGGRLGAGGGMATLCEVTDPEEVASLLIKARDAESDSMSERFRSMLGAVDRAFRSHADEPPDREMRRVFAGASGDRAELWDERAIAAPEPMPAAFPIKQPGPPEHEAVGSLRRRLAALRSETAPLEAPA